MNDLNHDPSIHAIGQSIKFNITFKLSLLFWSDLIDDLVNVAWDQVDVRFLILWNSDVCDVVDQQEYADVEGVVFFVADEIIKSFLFLAALDWANLGKVVFLFFWGLLILNDVLWKISESWFLVFSLCVAMGAKNRKNTVWLIALIFL